MAPPVSPGLSGPRDQLGRRVKRAFKVHWARREVLASKGLLDLAGLLVARVSRAPMGRQDQRGHRAPTALRGLRGYPVNRGQLDHRAQRVYKAP
jgi:hypothetical protein